jgi:hypothetical protein
MHVVTKADIALGVRSELEGAYGWLGTSGIRALEEIKALPEMTEGAVVAIMTKYGYLGWLRNTCQRCGSNVDTTVRFIAHDVWNEDEDDCGEAEIALCRSCLAAALDLIDGSTAVEPGA